ncbi:MAG: hypothetical protein ACKOE0_07085, partial [Actinomycetes bacterium]
MGDVSSHVGVSTEYLSRHLGVTDLKIESITAIGTGQIAERNRGAFVEGSNEQIPPSVVVKVPSHSE